MPFRASYWIDFTDGVLDTPERGRPSLVALEPEILGTWRVRVHLSGHQVFAMKGLEYHDALESLLGAFEVLAKEQGPRPSA
jgi:hypothetical protein